ncbi:MAG TPA: SH3 domain-containing protein [Sedimentisphaerales bacterium]|nr:SH3 domain-containing protein [Sedimentisphaerales bacterium]
MVILSVKSKLLVSALVAGMLSVIGTAQAQPSFDCSKASTRVENLICDKPRLAELDSELAEAYRIALRDAPWASANRRIRAEQKDWIAERNQCGAPRCLREVYKQRIDELRAEVSAGNGGNSESSGGSDLMQVTGVAANDVLNVRNGPGANYRIVGALGNGDTVRNLGCEAHGNSRWCEIEMMTDMRERGWVNGRFLQGSGGASGSAGGTAPGGSGAANTSTSMEAPEGVVYCGGGAVKRQIEYVILENAQDQWDARVTVNGDTIRAMTAYSYFGSNQQPPKGFVVALLGEDKSEFLVFRDGDKDWVEFGDYTYRKCN